MAFYWTQTSLNNRSILSYGTGYLIPHTFPKIEKLESTGWEILIFPGIILSSIYLHSGKIKLKSGSVKFYSSIRSIKLSLEPLTSG